MGSKLKSAINRLRHIKEHGEKMADGIFQVGETALATLGAGYANEKWGTNGELEILGVPADLLAGVALSGLAIASFAAGKHDHHAQHALNFGSGLMGAYTYRLGANLAGASGDVANAQFGPMPWASSAPAQQSQGWGYSPRQGHNKTYVTSGNPEMG